MLSFTSCIAAAVSAFQGVSRAQGLIRRAVHPPLLPPPAGRSGRWPRPLRARVLDRRRLVVRRGPRRLEAVAPPEGLGTAALPPEAALGRGGGARAAGGWRWRLGCSCCGWWGLRPSPAPWRGHARQSVLPGVHGLLPPAWRCHGSL